MPRRKQRAQNSRHISAIIGGVLLAIGFLWLISIVLQQQGTLKISWLNPLAGNDSGQIPALATAGVTLATPSQPAALNQQQALLFAAQWEPDAAHSAKSSSTRYVLLTYSGRSNLHDTPAWMIVYQQVPLPADSSKTSTHDLYVFIDANNGKELLVIWG